MEINGGKKMNIELKSDHCIVLEDKDGNRIMINCPFGAFEIHKASPNAKIMVWKQKKHSYIEVSE